MDERELAQEMLVFLNEFSLYSQFIEYMAQRGFDAEELESDIETLLD